MAPILNANMLEFVSHGPEQTQRLGSRLGALLAGGEIIALEGPLGAGKTHLAQGIGRGWGTPEQLLSPTFVLIREHRRAADRQRLYHVDLYRVADAGEAWALGLDEVLGDPEAVCLIEWAERIREWLPPDHLWIRLVPQDDSQRMLHFEAQGSLHTQLLRRFRRAAFGR